MAKEDKSKQDKAGRAEKKPAPAAQQQAPKAKKEAQAPKKDAPAKPAAPEMPAPPARLGLYYREKVVLDNALSDMTKIAGQKPVVTKARRSIANFKVRAGFPVGCMVTLRGARMYEFLDRLVHIAIPRLRG